MSNKPVGNPATIRWAPIVVGAATAGVVVGQASERMGLTAASALAVIAGLGVAGLVYVVLTRWRG